MSSICLLRLGISLSKWSWSALSSDQSCSKEDVSYLLFGTDAIRKKTLDFLLFSEKDPFVICCKIFRLKATLYFAAGREAILSNKLVVMTVLKN